MRNPYSDFQKKINKSIRQSQPPMAAKVVSREGTYTVETLDGLTMANIPNQSAVTKFQADDWVSLEFVSGDWVITGRSERRGGD